LTTLKINGQGRIAAVEGKRRTLNGFVRISGRDERAHLEGLCLFFNYNSNNEQLSLFKSSAFFHGNTQELAINYWNQVSPNLGGHIKDYQTYPDFIFWYERIPSDLFNIPFSAMDLDRAHEALALRLMDSAEIRLPGAMQTITQVYRDSKSKRGKNPQFNPGYHDFSSHVFSQLRCKFPYLFVIDAEKKERYNYGRVCLDCSKSVQSPPVARIISTPWGGLPNWAREYVRRRQS
jgi:hypothetical protein